MKHSPMKTHTALKLAIVNIFQKNFSSYIFPFIKLLIHLIDTYYIPDFVLRLRMENEDIS